MCGCDNFAWAFPSSIRRARIFGWSKVKTFRACTVSKVVVTAYEDAAEGKMLTNPDGSGEFTSVTLKPRITITSDSDAAIADSLHGKANAMCFIARSVNFPIKHEAEIISL